MRGETRGDHERLAARAEVPLLGQHRGQHAAEEDVVEVEEAGEPTAIPIRRCSRNGGMRSRRAATLVDM
jgi:hypothetical protein